MKHGTTAYRDGCRCSTCRRAMADAAIVRRNLLYLGRTDTLAVSPLGTHRRIRALVALGWSMSSISRHCGYDRSHVALILRRSSPLHIGTVRRIGEAFEELSMRLPPQTTKIEKIDASRARNIAKRNGWPPPLAWDDIDDPNEQPKGSQDQPRIKTGGVPDEWNNTVDEVVVERLLSGGGRARKLTRAEASIVVHRLLARGHSTTEIEGWYGFKTERYVRIADRGVA